MPNKLTIREVSLMPTPYVWNTHGVASKASYRETEKKKKKRITLVEKPGNHYLSQKIKVNQQ